MGLTFTKLFARLFSKKEMRILMVRARFPALRCAAQGHAWLPAPHLPNKLELWGADHPVAIEGAAAGWECVPTGALPVACDPSSCSYCCCAWPSPISPFRKFISPPLPVFECPSIRGRLTALIELTGGRTDRGACFTMLFARLSARGCTLL
jgi:hypothetical protein